MAYTVKGFYRRRVCHNAGFVAAGGFDADGFCRKGLIAGGGVLFSGICL